ncbi:MAG: 4-hydroxy-tetrahydrodipicolinate synthase [Firmicutes bacterium]|nr:4-hydroxy-tetrahydrodipicolinate synthase [Bacillota bacterium]
MSVPWGRLLTAMVTPMKKDLSVDFDACARLARRLVESGSDGVVACGTTGESPTLSDEEKLGVFRAVAESVGGEAIVLAGTGTYSTEHSIHLTKAAEHAGVDGIMAVVPYYNKPPQEGLYQHFKAIAQSTSLPVMVYNIPGRTGQNLLPETLSRLAEIPNIVAIKEASGNLDQVSAVRKLTPPDFLVYSGDDSLTLPILSVGGTGVVSVASHIVGRRLKEMINAFQDGKVKQATKIHLELYPLLKALFVTTNPIPVKRAVSLSGFDAGPVRPPLVELTDKEREILRGALQEVGIRN